MRNANLAVMAAILRRLEVVLESALNTPERASEWLYATASAGAASGDVAAATAALGRLLDASPSSYLGWTIPVDPVFLSLHGEPAFAAVLARLAERAA